MKTIIAGGRDVFLSARDKFRLNRHWKELPITEVVSGMAHGVDRDGAAWAKARGIPVAGFPADWGKHGRAAGPIRNEEMAKYVGPEGVLIAFPGGVGTNHMVKTAQRLGLKVIDYRSTQNEKRPRTAGVLFDATKARVGL